MRSLLLSAGAGVVALACLLAVAPAEAKAQPRLLGLPSINYYTSPTNPFVGYYAPSFYGGASFRTRNYAVSYYAPPFNGYGYGPSYYPGFNGGYGLGFNGGYGPSYYPAYAPSFYQPPAYNIYYSPTYYTPAYSARPYSRVYHISE